MRTLFTVAVASAVGSPGPAAAIPTFVDLQRPIIKHTASILAAIEHGLSNGRIESVNTKIRLITRVAFGFKSPTPSSPWPCSPRRPPPTLPGRR